MSSVTTLAVGRDVAQSDSLGASRFTGWYNVKMRHWTLQEH